MTETQMRKDEDALMEFALNDDRGREWRLSDHRGKVVVLLFYPQNETLVCTRQMCSVRDRWRDYLETSAVIVGISPATPDQHAEFSRKHHLPIPLLADPGRVVTKRYAKHNVFPAVLTRAIIVVDAKGMIRTRSVMLRAFRPNDDDVIANIYAARVDALDAKYRDLSKRIRRVII